MREVYLLERDRRLAGFYGLGPRGEECEMRFLYLEGGPGAGDVATELWRHAVRTARRLGFAALLVRSSEATEGFFAGMGAERIGVADGGRDGTLFRYPLLAEPA